MSNIKSNGGSFWTPFFLITALITPPIMWLILLLHAKPEDRGHILIETLKKPLTYVWLGYAAVIVWFALKANFG